LTNNQDNIEVLPRLNDEESSDEGSSDEGSDDEELSDEGLADERDLLMKNRRIKCKIICLIKCEINFSQRN